MHKKLKIAIYSGQIPSSTFIESLIHTISKNHTILLFGTQTKRVSYKNKNIKIHRTPISHWWKFFYNISRSAYLILKRPKDFIALIKHLKTIQTTYKKWQLFSKLLPIISHKPDIVHIQWAKSLNDFMVLQTLYDIPIVLSLRGAHINYSPIVSENLAQSYVKNFPKIIAFHAVSEAIRKEAEKYGAVNNKIKVIHSFVPKMFLDAYLPLKPKSTNTIKIISIGRPHWIKGYTYAIRAIAKLLHLGYSVEYKIVGIHTLDEELLYLITELGLENTISFQASLPQKDLIDLMQKHDVLLLSSIAEGIANVVLEAMAVGLPVIATNCGGMREVVKPMETGFLVPTRSDDAIVQAVLDLHKMPHKQLQTQTRKAHQLIKKQFDLEDNRQQFLELYQILFKMSHK